MNQILPLFLIILFFFGCEEKKVIRPELPNTKLIEALHVSKNFSDAEYEAALEHFKRNCSNSYARSLYGTLCEKALHVTRAADFFKSHLTPYKIVEDEVHPKGLLTGYYEPLLMGSRTKSERFRYPIYEPPSDLLHVKLEDAYPELKGKRLRGRLVDGKVIAYDDREGIVNSELNATTICYVDDRIARFFLEVQGSGRIKLDDAQTIYIGYADQNGHRYSSIGKALIERGAIAKEDISLQSIAQWLGEHPKAVDEILHVNRSYVFFKERAYAATGAMGVELTPLHSVAVDPNFIPYGAMLSLKSERFRSLVFAEDTGGAIRGSVRADLFSGFGSDAMAIAGGLKEALELWVWLPKAQQGTISP